MGAIQDVEKSFLRTDLPGLNPGDTVIVKVKIKEGDNLPAQINSRPFLRPDNSAGLSSPAISLWLA